MLVVAVRPKKRKTRMANYKHVVSLLMTIALVPAHAFGNEPPKVVVKGKHDPSTVVVKGVRDPSAWFRIESQHLIVYSNDDPDDVIELVNNLERLDAVLRLYLKPFLDGRETLPKFTLYFQGRPDLPPELGAVDGSATALTSSCASGTLAFTFSKAKSWKLDNASLLRPEDDYTLMTNFWVYADNFLRRHTRIRAPGWFLAGFDAYFGGVRFTDNQMLVGRDGGTSYNLLQEIDEGRIRRLRFDDVLHDRAPSGIFAVGTPSYYRQWEFLGRSFNLVHYMLSSEDNRNRMGKYLELVNEGSDSADAFADVFGLSGQELDAAMWRYRQASMNILQVDVPDLPRADIEFTRLSRIEGEFVLDNAALKTCPAPADGKTMLARLQQKAAQAPAVDFARITLSRAQVEWGDPAGAIEYLTHAVENDPYNPEPHYLLGLAHTKLAESAGTDRQGQLAAARASLTQAALLAPEAPDVSYALFRVALMDTEPAGRDIGRAIDAWRHGHDVTAFARAAALAHAWLGDAAGAYQVFNTLARNTRDPESAAWATTWLARLEKGVSRDTLLAAMRTEQPTVPGARSWMHSRR
jgi:tetratricopeptide (TPR) repeat protein